LVQIFKLVFAQYFRIADYLYSINRLSLTRVGYWTCNANLIALIRAVSLKVEAGTGLKISGFELHQAIQFELGRARLGSVYKPSFGLY